MRTKVTHLNAYTGKDTEFVELIDGWCVLDCVVMTHTTTIGSDFRTKRKKSKNVKMDPI